MGIKHWTKEEELYLEEHWGRMVPKTIGKKLGRSVEAVKGKAHKMGLGSFQDNIEGLSVHLLAKAIGVDYKRIKNWMERYGFPIKLKKVGSEKEILWITIEEFWKWAKTNRHMMDFSKMEYLTLGKEPDWVKAKRDADFIKARKIKKSNEHPWTAEEDNILKGMLNAFMFTYPEIADRIKRSEGAIKGRIRTLGLKTRPVRANVTYPYEDLNPSVNARNWTEEDDNRLRMLVKDYQHNVVEVAVALNRTVGSIKRRIVYLPILDAELKEYIPPRRVDDGRFTKDPNRVQLPAKMKKKEWSIEENAKLMELCQQQVTAPEIAKRLDRTLSSVKNRMRKLGITARPLDEYTPAQVDFIVSSIQKGHCLEDIAGRIGRTALGVRGKLERMGYKFKNGVPLPPTKGETSDEVSRMWRTHPRHRFENQNQKSDSETGVQKLFNSVYHQ